MKNADCDCVILCGGLGTRLRTAVKDVPKVMAQVNGRPFLDLIIEHLKGQGVDRIVLCTGYQADLVESYYREHYFGLTIDFSRENQPLGTGGALKNAHPVIFSDPFLVFNGDSFLPVDLEAFLDFHQKNDALVSILASPAGQSADFGTLEIDRSGQVISFREKIQEAKEPLVNAGIYCFDGTIFEYMPEEERFSLENDFFPSLIGEKFYGYRTDKKFMDIGTPERYQAAKDVFKKRKSSEDRK
ncbi:MAG TPA: nucleotidyltransferase family protein [Candidatus Omnitrophota bacterium]|mgnify:CR=1 FL=1|nr:nucleotidyltransferase family protein [Candidatus Omnitrophota bacterium]